MSINHKESWRPEKGFWASTRAVSFGDTITITRPVAVRYLFQCPHCFALFVRTLKSIACEGKKKRITLLPVSENNLPEGLVLRDFDLKAAQVFSQSCECFEPLTQISSYEHLSEAFDLLKIQIECFQI